MGTYDVQQVCLNGHQITANFSSYPARRKKHCSSCGAETITACPECNTPILGSYDVPGVFDFNPTSVPPHCHQCGHPYPWTEKNALEADRQEKATALAAPLHLVESVCTRFHDVARQLRRRHDNRPTLNINDEYDVQDLLHALLRLHFEDIRPEEWTPSIAGACARMDFLLKNEQIVLEVKKTRKGLGAKEIGNQLIEDIARYQNSHDCKILVCFVYDPEGLVVNARGLEHDLQQSKESLTVKILIRPM